MTIILVCSGEGRRDNFVVHLFSSTVSKLFARIYTYIYIYNFYNNKKVKIRNLFLGILNVL